MQPVQTHWLLYFKLALIPQPLPQTSADFRLGCDRRGVRRGLRLFLCSLVLPRFLVLGSWFSTHAILAAMNTSAPIGVFDSGVGGLSVLHDIRAALPNEALIYVADSSHVPYGSKSQEYIQERSIVLSRFL